MSAAVTGLLPPLGCRRYRLCRHCSLFPRPPLLPTVLPPSTCQNPAGAHTVVWARLASETSWHPADRGRLGMVRRSCMSHRTAASTWADRLMFQLSFSFQQDLTASASGLLHSTLPVTPACIIAALCSDQAQNSSEWQRVALPSACLPACLQLSAPIGPQRAASA